MTSALLATLDPLADVTAPWVAFSGGLDSTALLHLARRRGLTPRAVHIHHGLHPDADAWQAHCEQLCERWGVPLQVHRVVVERAGQGTEAAAREARFAVFRALLAPGEYLLLAQHQDDQVETFLLRALRGAGPDGLGAMAVRRPLGQGTLLRPLLDTPRSVLRDYAQQEGLNWVEDSSNSDTGFDRNYLRRQVLPQVEARWPGYRATLSRSARLLRETAAALPVPALAPCASTVGDPGFLLATLPESNKVAAHALRRWLRDHALQAPSEARLRAFLAQLRGGGGAQLRSGEYILQRYRDGVFAYPVLPAPCDTNLLPGQQLEVTGAGAVRFDVTAPGDGAWQLRFRRGGERLAQSDGHHLGLKTLFQTLAVPPWWRDRVPLLYRDDALQAVGPYRRTAGAQAAAVTLAWEPPLCPHPGA